MTKTTICTLALSLLVGATAVAAERPFTCSLKVGNPVREAKQNKPKDAKGGGSSETKTTRQKFTWPVTVSFTGKDFPQSGVSLKCYCIGTENGEGSMLQTKDVPVKLDEKGKFKYDFASPEVVMTKTRSRKGNNGGGGGSSSSGTRVSGCIVQLIIDNKVERTFETKPAWKKFAKANPIPEEELLKIH